jgi:molecular chaperone GrpE (heat shock protein)
MPPSSKNKKSAELPKASTPAIDHKPEENRPFSGKPETDVPAVAGTDGLKRLETAMRDEIQPREIPLDLNDLGVTAQPHRPEPDDRSTVAEKTTGDMQFIITKLDEFSDQFAMLAQRLDSIEQSLEKQKRSLTIELGKLRDELLSERKAFIGRATFNAILPALESLDLRRQGLSEAGDDVSLKHVSGVYDLLTIILQSIGFSTFRANPGDPFDANCMECSKFEEGEPGKVLRVERAGYRAGGVIAKPCTVVVGRRKKA